MAGSVSEKQLVESPLDALGVCGVRPQWGGDGVYVWASWGGGGLAAEVCDGGRAGGGNPGVRIQF